MTKKNKDEKSLSADLVYKKIIKIMQNQCQHHWKQDMKRSCTLSGYWYFVCWKCHAGVYVYPDQIFQKEGEKNESK